MMAFDGPFNNVKSLKLNANDNNIVVTDEDFAEIELTPTLPRSSTPNR